MTAFKFPNINSPVMFSLQIIIALLLLVAFVLMCCMWRLTKNSQMTQYRFVSLALLTKTILFSPSMVSVRHCRYYRANVPFCFYFCFLLNI